MLFSVDNSNFVWHHFRKQMQVHISFEERSVESDFRISKVHQNCNLDCNRWMTSGVLEMACSTVILLVAQIEVLPHTCRIFALKLPDLHIMEESRMSVSLPFGDTDRNMSANISEPTSANQEDLIELKNKPETNPKRRRLNNASPRKNTNLDPLLDETVSKNVMLKRKNKEIQERLEKLVKIYTRLIERKQVVFLKSSEPNQ